MSNKECLPVGDPDYWKKRVEKYNDEENLHRSVFNVGAERWIALQLAHKRILERFIKPHTKVLDAGCGYGGLCEVMPTCEYTGVDISPELIRMARLRYASFVRAKFNIMDLRSLNYGNKSFDIVVCRALEGMIRGNQGDHVWEEIEHELLRVSHKVILLGYELPDVYHTIDSKPHPESERDVITYVEHEHGRIIYKVEPGNVCQVSDIWVDRKHRQDGIATMMHQSLFDKGFNTVYGFSKADNGPIIALQKKLGFKHELLKSFYGGSDAVIAYRNRSTTNE